MPFNRIAITGYLTLFILLTLSIIFYKERTVFLDISFHLFAILKEGSFTIQNNRFGAFFTQLFPLLGGKAGLSLPVIAMLYSASFVLLQIITFSLILLLKESKVALAYLLFVVLMTTHTFYWIQSELPQAMAYLFLFIALLNKMSREVKPRIWQIVTSCLLLLVVCFTHPLTLFAFFFIIAFWGLSNRKKGKTALAFALIYLFFYLVKVIFFKTNYDSQAMGGLQNISSLFPHYLDIASNKNYLSYFIKDYYFVSLLLVVVIVFYSSKKEFLKPGLVVLSFLIYSFIVNISFSNGAHQFYAENQYLLLGFMIAVPFATDIYPKIRNQRIQLGIIILICTVSIFRIYHMHIFYTTRLNWNRQQIARSNQLKDKKLVIPLRLAPKDTLIETWGTSYEIWLLSTIEHNVSSSIIIEEQPNEFDWAMQYRRLFIVRWGCFEYNTLNPKYFRFNDTSLYVKLK